VTILQPALPSHVGDNSADVAGPTSRKDTDDSGGARARCEMTSLPTTHVAHMLRIVESYDRCNDAARLLDTCSGIPTTTDYAHFGSWLLRSKTNPDLGEVPIKDSIMSLETPRRSDRLISRPYEAAHDAL